MVLLLYARPAGFALMYLTGIPSTSKVAGFSLVSSIVITALVLFPLIQNFVEVFFVENASISR